MPATILNNRPAVLAINCENFIVLPFRYIFAMQSSYKYMKISYKCK